MSVAASFGTSFRSCQIVSPISFSQQSPFFKNKLIFPSKNVMSSVDSCFSASKLQTTLAPVLLEYVVVEAQTALTRRCITPSPKVFFIPLLSARYDTIHMNRIALRFIRSESAVRKAKIRSTIEGQSQRRRLTTFVLRRRSTKENGRSPRSLTPSSIFFMSRKAVSPIPSPFSRHLLSHHKPLTTLRVLWNRYAADDDYTNPMILDSTSPKAFVANPKLSPSLPLLLTMQMTSIVSHINILESQSYRKQAASIWFTSYSMMSNPMIALEILADIANGLMPLMSSLTFSTFSARFISSLVSPKYDFKWLMVQLMNSGISLKASRLRASSQKLYLHSLGYLSELFSFVKISKLDAASLTN